MVNLALYIESVLVCCNNNKITIKNIIISEIVTLNYYNDDDILFIIHSNMDMYT